MQNNRPQSVIIPVTGQSIAAEAAAGVTVGTGGSLGTPSMQAAARKVMRLRDANSKRLDAFLRTHRGALEGEARRQLDCRASAEDAVQECALKILSTDQQFDPARAEDVERGFRAWVYKILANVCSDMRRNMNRQVSGVPFASVPEVVIEAASIDPAPSPDALLCRKLGIDGDTDMVRAAFFSLQGSYQWVLEQCVIFGVEEAVVAKRSGYTAGAIRSLLMVARDALRMKVDYLKDNQDTWQEVRESVYPNGVPLLVPEPTRWQRPSV